MAYSQQIPKENPARRNKPSIPDTILIRRKDDELIGPDLPKTKAWCSETKEWWDMWRKHEIAPKLEPSDWETLKGVAVLHNEFWIGAVPPATMVSLWSEIRRGVAAFGATLEDRLKLRIKFADNEESKSKSEPKRRSVDYSSLLEE